MVASRRSPQSLSTQTETMIEPSEDTAIIIIIIITGYRKWKNIDGDWACYR